MGIHAIKDTEQDLFVTAASGKGAHGADTGAHLHEKVVR